MQIIEKPLTAKGMAGPYLKGLLKSPDPAAGQTKLPAIIIIPGGAYTHIPVEQTETMALAFANQGFQSFYLRYSFMDEAQPLMPQPLIELAKAVQLLHQNADEWQLDSDKIVIAGFSVGGHIVGLYNDYWDSAWLTKATGFGADELKINAAIMGYPVVSPKLGFPKDAATVQKWADDPDFIAADEQVTATNAPTFVWTTLDDNVVPSANSLAYVEALKTAEVSVESHLFRHGPHGLALANQQTGNDSETVNPHVGHWFELATEWLNDILD
ncbi:alpha/beta hydrolase [Loigolactobacillus backii]|uniref:Esterase n=1 Tax=Loigolactobacillus backii TaxID=375175 RepID=A0A192H2I7_9LACO|nr:alpha/beta hydrolase [Loigolactobacillus backii]ANK60404.1 esterase [Loigolactobacillus backii]ANK62156.1 esterase [Loigolactobacillus backii]ANK65283.1 esterase [Loigolactobacillus backii]ANK67843.1 esterase [Loigolactobacillus backii]ANK70830.1 esterase [Loigolactobacillus backii]